MRSDDEETAQTVGYMDELAAADASDRAVIAAAAEALEAAGIDARSSTPMEQACAVYWWLKRTIRYVPTPGTSPLVDQTLITPCAVLAMPEPIGDCPQFSMLAAAIFRVLCIPSLFVTIAAEPSFPDQWSHIYNTVEIEPGRFMPFDASNGPSPGAEYAKPFKRRVWPRLTPGKCANKEGSTEMMRSSTHHRTPGSMRNRTLRGALGAVNCDQDGNCYDDSSGIYTPGPTGSYDSTDPLGDQISAINDLSDSVYGSGSPSGSTTINLNPGSSPGVNPLNLLITDAAAAAAPLIKAATTQQPYYITNPVTGQSVLYNPNTGTTAGSLSSSLSALSPTTLLIGVVGLLAAFAFAGKK